jgi:hypothetical protein
LIDSFGSIDSVIKMEQQATPTPNDQKPTTDNDSRQNLTTGT